MPDQTTATIPANVHVAPGVDGPPLRFHRASGRFEINGETTRLDPDEARELGLALMCWSLAQEQRWAAR